MRFSEQHTLQDVLHRSESNLGQLVAKAQQWAQLNEQLHEILLPEIALHASVSYVEEGILVLVADSSAWATRLRFETPRLLSHFRTHTTLCGLKSIQVKVRKGDL